MNKMMCELPMDGKGISPLSHRFDSCGSKRSSTTKMSGVNISMQGRPTKPILFSKPKLFLRSFLGGRNWLVLEPRDL